MATIQPAITGNTYTREVVLGYAQRRRDVHTLSRLHVMRQHTLHRGTGWE